jgi:predicted  nucleic acid-binding Zn-ribbon protein
MTDDISLENTPNIEEMLIKAESDIRNHIKIEFQLKLYGENMKQRCEDLEKIIKENNLQIIKLTDELRKMKTQSVEEKKDRELKFLNTELDSLKKIISSYETQTTKIADLENTIRSMNKIKEHEMKQQEEKYKNIIAQLNLTITKYEEILKIKIRKGKTDGNDVSPFKNKTKYNSSYIEEEELNYKNVTLFSIILV